jgi:hypothetical protein
MNDGSLSGPTFQGMGIKIKLLINQNQIGDVEDNVRFLVGLDGINVVFSP